MSIEICKFLPETNEILVSFRILLNFWMVKIGVISLDLGERGNQLGVLCLDPLFLVLVAKVGDEMLKMLN